MHTPNRYESQIDSSSENLVVHIDTEMPSVLSLAGEAASQNLPPTERINSAPKQIEATALAQETSVFPWFSMDEAVVGLAHRAQKIPCQDAAIAQHVPRPFIVLADGAGSAVVSDLGAQAVVTGLARLVHTLEGQWLPLLDSADSDNNELLSKWPMLLVKHARGILDDTAKLHRRDIRDLRCTLLGALVGRERFLWFKVGDGELVAERTEWDDAQNPVRQCCVLGERGKGDYANQTIFIDVAKPEDVQWGVESTQGVSGLVAMSDGAAERLVATDGSKVASRVSKLLDDLRNQQLKRQHLTQLFYSPEFCDRSSGDDRSIALLAKNVVHQLIPPLQSVKAEESMPLTEAAVQDVPAVKTLLPKQRKSRGKTR